MARVIISAGHTSADPGVISGDLREYELTRKIANAIIPHLRKSGLITLSVPPELDLARRIEWINTTGYRESLNDVAVEIHINDGGKSGVEAWFREEGGNKSENLSKKILDQISKDTGLVSQGAKSEYDHELGTLAFVHNSNPVSVLLECLYIDNDSDRAFLGDENKIDSLGKAIADGITKYLNLKPLGREKPEVKEPAFSVPAVQNDGQDDMDDEDDIVEPAPVSAPPVIPIQPIPQVQTQIPALPPRAPAPMAPSPVSAFGGAGGAGGFGGGSMGGGLGAGGFGGNNLGGGFGGGLGSNAGGFGGAAGASGTNFMQSREDRKKMVEETYRKVLGREANQNDLNYFLNIGITEDQLAKRMMDSQEHADLVKSRQDVVDLKKNYEESSTKLNVLETRTRDQEGIIKSLNSLLTEKNQALSDMNMIKREEERKQAKKEHERENNSAPSPSSAPEDPFHTYKPSLSDRIFKFFSDIFE